MDSDGNISGNTQLAATNLGGLGGLALNNGIEVVQALHGAVSSTDAFALKGSLSAGVYEYYLFKDGVTAGSENNWCLRSSVVAVQPPVVPTPPPVPPVVVTCHRFHRRPLWLPLMSARGTANSEASGAD